MFGNNEIAETPHIGFRLNFFLFGTIFCGLMLLYPQLAHAQEPTITIGEVTSDEDLRVRLNFGCQNITLSNNQKFDQVFQIAEINESLERTETIVDINEFRTSPTQLKPMQHTAIFLDLPESVIELNIPQSVENVLAKYMDDCKWGGQRHLAVYTSETNETNKTTPKQARPIITWEQDRNNILPAVRDIANGVPPSTTLFDAILDVASKFPNASNQKNLIVISDGTDDVSSNKEPSIIRAQLEEKNITLYTIWLENPGFSNYPNGIQMGKDNLRELITDSSRYCDQNVSQCLSSILDKLFVPINSFEVDYQSNQLPPYDIEIGTEVKGRQVTAREPITSTIVPLQLTILEPTAYQVYTHTLSNTVSISVSVAITMPSAELSNGVWANLNNELSISCEFDGKPLDECKEALEKRVEGGVSHFNITSTQEDPLFLGAHWLKISVKTKQYSMTTESERIFVIQQEPIKVPDPVLGFADTWNSWLTQLQNLVIAGRPDISREQSDAFGVSLLVFWPIMLLLFYTLWRWLKSRNVEQDDTEAESELGEKHLDWDMHKDKIVGELYLVQGSGIPDRITLVHGHPITFSNMNGWKLEGKQLWLGLNSPYIYPEHCALRFKSHSQVEVVPRNGGSKALTQIDNERLDSPRELKHGQTLQLGPHFKYIYRQTGRPFQSPRPMNRGPIFEARPRHIEESQVVPAPERTETNEIADDETEIVANPIQKNWRAPIIPINSEPLQAESLMSEPSVRPQNISS